ncbi:hypothetical protein HZS_356 [Henneguya salminicola]|nr:hypothetical protein HZS_356 [Henneguya salminicola]
MKKINDRIHPCWWAELVKECFPNERNQSFHSHKTYTLSHQDILAYPLKSREKKRLLFQILAEELLSAEIFHNLLFCTFDIFSTCCFNIRSSKADPEGSLMYFYLWNKYLQANFV